ncbi:PDZ and LIM domain protein 2 isoform X2 [Periophthalmus magnuspinnatus]|uniref:PDZ and LIM domain protein 2 isoform X2 n=1 Tax=Periophthalmus magnuspinnatus TaxID=409849 RepID=UPI00145A8254|nr:PDZ and LIM domain protein 2 isoform X2 [Periophthalmus magnuspinnatus]
MALNVNLAGPSPWGFRIYGGRDFKKAITVSKVNEGSKAERANLQPGDIILEINGENTTDMLNVEAQNKIRSAKTELQLLVKRPDVPALTQTNGIKSPDQLTGRFQESLIVSRDENQNYREYSFSTPASLSPRPYSPDLHASPNGKILSPNNNKGVERRSWSPEERGLRSSRPLSQELSPDYRSQSLDYRSHSLSSRTPTPPGRYSPNSPTDRDVPMSPRRSSGPDFAMQKFDKDSEVYKMIQENRESRTAPRQSNTFKMLQEVLEADEKEAALMFPGNLSPNPPKTSSVAGVNKHHTCEKCGTSIMSQAVRITDDRFRHPECYTCSDCGLNLRMRGHFWVDDVMYCEKHANERYHGPGRSPHY